MYLDFVNNWVIYRHLLERNPKSVLELGPARGYILKRLEDDNIPCCGLEISQHCQLTRATDKIVEWDICQTPWPIKDKQFDLCFSLDVLDCLPETDLHKVVKEIERTCKRGLHVIDFNQKTPEQAKSKVTIKSKEWWIETLKSKNEVVDKVTFITPKLPFWDYIPLGDGKIKVNIGSHLGMAHYDWTNIDVIDLSQFAKDNYYKFYQRDIKQGLPFPDNSIDLMYSSHCLEHLSYDDGLKFLRDCYRAMKPGAVARFLVPDAEKLISQYQAKQLDVYNEVNDGAASRNYQAGKLWEILLVGHSAIYDYDAFTKILNKAGFDKVWKGKFREGHKQILSETIDMLPDFSLFVEFSK